MGDQSMLLQWTTKKTGLNPASIGLPRPESISGKFHRASALNNMITC
jgi:hypothetical protein